MSATSAAPVPTACDLRIEIARHQLKRRAVALKAGVDPARLYLLLSERAVLVPELAVRIMQAIEELAAAQADQEDRT